MTLATLETRQSCQSVPQKCDIVIDGTQPRSVDQAIRNWLRSIGWTLRNDSVSTGPEWVTGIISSHCRKHERGVSDRARHRALYIVSRKSDTAAVRRNEPRRSAMRNDATEEAGVRRLPPVSNQCISGPSRLQAPPRSPRKIRRKCAPCRRVHRGAENRILGIGTGTELRRVCLSNNDSAGLPQCRNNALVFRGYVIRMERRAKGRQYAFVTFRSFTPICRPCKAPRSWPRMTASSAA